MIRINQVKLPVEHTSDALHKKVQELLKYKGPMDVEIVKRSLDARKKPQLFYVYVVDVSVPEKEESKLLRRCHNNRIQKIEPVKYEFPVKQYEGKVRPVIVGMGPAGLFCGYVLAKAGFRPILLERGKCVEDRSRDVEAFWETGHLNTESNVQFGEGGAGTFSDGKLNTLIKDKYGRNKEVLRIFVKHGAPEEILYDYKPHIGTDILKKIVRSMREEIIALGGEVRFETRVTDLLIAGDRIKGLVLNGEEELPAEHVVLALGHSARDTFSMLHKQKVAMKAKPFAIGMRVEHPQELINLSQYGKKEAGALGNAIYKLTAETSEKRGVYTFCMCPGGYVVNASSEERRLAVNGMSYSGRNSANANSAVIITIIPEDYGDSKDPLSGVAFQRKLEEKAYQIGNGKVPVERYGSFKRAILRTKAQEAPDGSEIIGMEKFTPCIKGQWTEAPVHEILPDALNRAFVEGMEAFGRKIRGFNGDEVFVEGIESRTSSPVRILRNESAQSISAEGLYPCGEGAGYAGGITSAAMDGIFVAEQLARALQEEV
ncbi:MAG: FAD-dependent oxidoreductase [Lachnospiraceae bacterium]|nr:FAD-dependent oxidoreductase [Lachnospiraceae bacterium]